VEKDGLLSLGPDIYNLSGLGWMADAMWARSWILQMWDDSTIQKRECIVFSVKRK